MIESRACPECGAEVPIGRLSCGACGALLASVDRHPAAEPLTGTGATIVSQAARVEVAAPIVPATVARTPVLAEVAEPAAPSPPTRGAAPTPGDSPAGPSDASQTATPMAMASPVAPSAAIPTPGAPPPATPPAPEEIELPRPPMPPIPGAYLAPSAVMRSASIATTQPLPSATGSHLERAPLLDRPLRGPELDSPHESASASPARVPVLELPFVIAPGIGPRLVAGGAGLAILAFVLPWAPDGGVVIGGAFGSGYFATWGLAAVGNVVPFLIAWVSLILAVLPNRAPRFAALVVLPLLLGGIFAGFAWTYLIAPLGAGVGIWALAVSAVLLSVGGTLALRVDG